MNALATRKIQLLCVYAGPLFALCWTLGLLIFAGFIPPLQPDLGREAVVAFYQQNGTGILIGMLFMMIGSGLVPVWNAVISIQMRRIERVPTLAYVQLGSGVFLMMTILLTAVIFATAAYRVDRDPALTYLLNDLGWIMFIWTFPPFGTQILSLAAAILLDNQKRPIFPRWVGWLNVWVALLSAPGCTIVFFKSGPFSWNGLFSFWIPISAYGAYMVVNAIYLIRAINDQPEVDAANSVAPALQPT